MNAVIRAMRPAEAHAVASLLVRANEENLSAVPAVVSDPYRAELRDAARRLSFGDVYVAEDDGRVVATATLLGDAADDEHPWPSGGAVLRYLAVDPAARGTGLGRRLTVFCIGVARACGARYLGLHTAPMMEAARHVYERLGFERAPEHDFHPGAHYGGQREPDGAPWGLAYVLRFETSAPGRTSLELPADPASAALARRAVRQAVAGLDVDVDTVVLCTSELVANALLHGAPPITLDVAVSDSTVRVGVADGDTTPVRRRRPLDDDTLSGRGLGIVDALAARWGCDHTADGKVTWFELRTG